MRDAIAMAREQRDPKTMIAGAEKIAALNGSDELEGPTNFELLEPHLIEIMLDPEAMKMLKMLTGKGAVDLDTLMGNVMNSMAEDITPDESRD